MLISPIFMLAISHIISPAGAATITARASTNKVRSSRDLINILPICGFRYGGSSSVNEDGRPFKIVVDSIFDTARVIKTPITIVTNKVKAAIAD